MMFVDFPDKVAVRTTQSLYDFLVPESKQWYSTASYGKLSLDIDADTSRFYRMPNPTSSYDWRRGLSAEQHGAYIQDALNVYFRDSGKTTFPTYDVLYVVPTWEIENPSFSPTYMIDVRTNTGQLFAKKTVTFGADVYLTWGYKTLNHETGHAMCLPDLYAENSNGLYVGGYDMMAYILGENPDYFGWMKWKLGWLADSQVRCLAGPGSSTHTVSSIEVAGAENEAKLVVLKHTTTDALVAEVRTNNGVDSSSPCGQGVLLYTVSTTVATGFGPVRVIDSKPGSIGCGNEPLNDAPLVLGDTFTVPGWGVTVSVTGQSGLSYTFTANVV